MDKDEIRKDKIITSEIQSVSDQNRIIRFVTSTEAQDRDGDVIEVAGWQIDNYMKNPVVLFGHDYSALPIGKTTNIELDTMNKRMIQDIQFAKREEYEFADTVYRMAKAGYLNTTSVGFMGIEHEPMFDDNKNYMGRRYKKQELLETSIVPVPSNPEALIEARSKGILNDKDLKFFSNSKIESTEKEDKTVKDEKSGASISASNKEKLQAIHDEMHAAAKAVKGCRDKLKEFMFPAGDAPESEDEDEMEEDGCGKPKPKHIEPEVVKEVTLDTLPEATIPAPIAKPIAEIENVPNADTVEVDENEIDIESMEDPDELDITEEQLDKALNAILDKKINQLQGGN